MTVDAFFSVLAAILVETYLRHLFVKLIHLFSLSVPKRVARNSLNNHRLQFCEVQQKIKNEQVSNKVWRSQNPVIQQQLPVFLRHLFVKLIDLFSVRCQNRCIENNLLLSVIQDSILIEMRPP